MDINNILIICGAIITLVVIAKMFGIPFKKIIKLIINSILGGVLIFIINQTTSTFGIHIGLNVITSIFIGIFGIPGVLLLIAIKFF